MRRKLAGAEGEITRRESKRAQPQARGGRAPGSDRESENELHDGEGVSRVMRGPRFGTDPKLAWTGRASPGDSSLTP